MRISLVLLASVLVLSVSEGSSSPRLVEAEDLLAVNNPLNTADDSAERMTAYHDAVSQVSNLMEVQNHSKDMCVKVTHEAIQGILDEVKNAQKVLDRMDNGAHCRTKGQRVIDHSKRNLTKKKMAVRTANRRLKQAFDARIDVTSTFNTANANCKTFFNSVGWKKARKRVEDRKQEVSKAKQMVKDAQKDLIKEEKAARVARCQCKTTVTRQAQNALAQARKFTPQRRKSIIRETMVLCLVQAGSKGKSAKQCVNKGLNAKYRSKLELQEPKLVKCFGCNVNEKCNPIRTKARLARKGTGVKKKIKAVIKSDVERRTKAHIIARTKTKHARPHKYAVGVVAKYTVHRNAVCKSAAGAFRTYNQNALWNMARAPYRRTRQESNWDYVCRGLCNKAGKRCKAFTRYWKYGEAYCTLHSRVCSLRRDARTKGDVYYVKQ